MLSSMDLERLITEKRLELEREKTQLGLSPLSNDSNNCQHEDGERKGNSEATDGAEVKVTSRKLYHQNVSNEDQGERKVASDVEDSISPDLERYIRRYLGLPVMLKAGEYSPNNPLVRGERSTGDALLGLGEYERRRNTLRKIRQQQYREYLDEQAKKKQEAKEKAEKERRDREAREREEEERERERLEREEIVREEERRLAAVRSPERNISGWSHNNKVDMGVQVGISRPLSVAVQTDDMELFQLSPPLKAIVTEAERELSPRTVVEVEGGARPGRCTSDSRRNSCEQHQDRYPTVNKSNRDKLMCDLQHSNMSSMLNSDEIQQRNLEAQQDAQARRQFYQQELRHQILEQQKLKEERRAREKMLEQAEMRRMEDQLNMLRLAQDREVDRQRDICVAMKENATDYEKKRNSLQHDIEREQKNLLRAATQPNTILRRHTSYSDRQTDAQSKLPYYYPKAIDKTIDNVALDTKQPYSTNIPENSIFSPNYDVDTYLRKNLNPSREKLLSNRISTGSTDSKVDSIESEAKRIDLEIEKIGQNYYENKIVEKALIHERPKERNVKYEPSILRKSLNEEHLPIPVLRHSPKYTDRDLIDDKNDLSDAMRVVDDKWKVPIVQKTSLKSLPNSQGKNVNILTQLGSIRRQLQLEQMRLDKLAKKDNA